MICPNCNNELQDGVAFCKYCGTSLKDYKPEAEEKTVIIPDDTATVVIHAEEPAFIPPEEPAYVPEEEPVYTPPVPPEEPAYDAYEEAYEEAPKKKGKAGKVVGIVVGALLLLAAIGFGVWMMLQKNEAEDKLEAKEKSLQSTQSELDSAKEELADAMEDCGNYETYVDAVDSICEFANYSSCGYASELFHVDQGIIVLEEGDDYKTITLTTAFEGGGSYDCYVDYGTGAYAEFDEDEWSGDTTTVSVVRDDYDLEEGEIGVTVINFTNNINDQSFSILVITLN